MMKRVFYQLTQANLNLPHVPRELVNILLLINILHGYPHRFYQAAIVVLLMANLFPMAILGSLMGKNMNVVKAKLWLFWSMRARVQFQQLKEYSLLVATVVHNI